MIPAAHWGETGKPLRNHRSYAEKWGYDYEMLFQRPVADEEPQFGKLQVDRARLHVSLVMMLLCLFEQVGGKGA